jgi:hypothetical protein
MRSALRVPLMLLVYFAICFAIVPKHILDRG